MAVLLASAALADGGASAALIRAVIPAKSIGRGKPPGENLLAVNLNWEEIALRYIAIWFWPVFFLIYSIVTGNFEGFFASFFQIGLLGCGTTAVYLVYDLFHDGDALFDIMDASDVGDHICRIGIIADALILVIGLFQSRLTVVADWFVSNGLLLNLIYFGAVLLTVLFYYLSKHLGGGASAFSSKEMVSKQKQAIGLLLFIPSLMILTFNGQAAGRMELLKPIALGEWSFINYVTLAAFAIILLKLIIQDGFIHKNWGGVWETFFIESVLMIASFAYLVLERLFVTEFGSTWLGIILHLVFLAIDTIFILYSYIFIFYPILKIGQAMLEANDGGDVHDPEREAYEKELDDRERIFNALTGTGPVTDQTAAEFGLKSAQEQLTDQLYREDKLREYDKKHGKK